MDRINLIAKLCEGSDTVVDIGCDHAYALIKAIKEYGVKRGIASDINEGPLENAKENIRLNCLSDVVDTVLSDGFKNINASFDTVIISGMGGILIKSILENGLEKINGKRVIIEANTDSDIVRKYLVKNGFYIMDEYSLYDDEKYYEIIIFEPGKEVYASFELNFGPVLLAKKEEAFITEYTKRLMKLEEYLPNIKDTIQKDEKLVLRNNYFKVLLGDKTKMIPIGDTDNYYREYFIDNKKRPLIIIAAGGGYKYTSPRESEPIAEFYNEHGYHAVIVNYRETLDLYPVPAKVLADVINIYNKDEIVSVKLGLGFSAGGHCMLEVALHQDLYKTDLDYMILGYPVVTSNPNYWHKGSFKNLLGELNDENLLNRVSEETQVTEKAPELFLWSTFTDESVPLMNSLLLVEAYRKVNRNCEYHMYPMGGHGLSLANSKSSGGDKNKEIPYVAQWAELSVAWLEGKLNSK